MHTRRQNNPDSCGESGGNEDSRVDVRDMERCFARILSVSAEKRGFILDGTSGFEIEELIT